MSVFESLRSARRAVPLVASIVGLTVMLVGVEAGEQRRRGRSRLADEVRRASEAGNPTYDGRFTFVRLRYADGLSGGLRRGWGLPPWAHDYPRAERNFMKILDEITSLAPFMGVSGGSILTLDDPDLFKYPVAYMSEPGYWTLTEAETLALRGYVEKGGFLIFDDFRGGHWINFEAQLRQVLPGGRLIQLEAEHPIFHSFFEIDSLDFVQFYGRGARASFHGVFEDNDPNKRLLLIANYNNDIGEYWEYSDTGFTPIELSNEAYKLGVNYIIYAMTH